MLKKVYSCNLCHEETEPHLMMGLHFSNMHDFVLADTRSTDGTHVCMRCLNQLAVQLAPKRASPTEGSSRP